MAVLDQQLCVRQLLGQPSGVHRQPPPRGATCPTLWQQLAQCLCSTLQDTNLQAPLARSYLQQQQHAGAACVSYVHHPIQVGVLAAAAPPHVIEVGGLMIKGEFKDAQALDKAGDCSSACKQLSGGLVARQMEHCRRP